MTHNENKPILLKPQVIQTFILLNDDTRPHKIPIIIKNGKLENCISIGRRDIFFDKEGNCIGEGIDLVEKEKK